MNPTSELFSYISILPLLAALCWAISNIVLKFIPEDISSVKINFYSINFSYIGSLIILLFSSDFSPVENSFDWLLLILIGILGGVASILFSFSTVGSSASYTNFPTTQLTFLCLLTLSGRDLVLVSNILRKYCLCHE